MYSIVLRYNNKIANAVKVRAYYELVNWFIDNLEICKILIFLP